MNEYERVCLHKFIYLLLLEIVDILVRHSPGKGLQYQNSEKKTTRARRVSINKQGFISYAIVVVKDDCLCSTKELNTRSTGYCGPKAHTKWSCYSNRRCRRMNQLIIG